jgi:hypothetical protein
LVVDVNARVTTVELVRPVIKATLPGAVENGAPGLHVLVEGISLTYVVPFAAVLGKVQLPHVKALPESVKLA